MDAAEIADLAEVGPQALVKLLRDCIGIAFQLLGTVLCNFGDGGLRRVPVPRGVLIEVCRGGAQTPERVPENRGRLSGHHASEFDLPVFAASICGTRGRCGAQIDGSGNSPASGELAKIRDLAVES